MMNITLNGTGRDLPDNTTISQLLDQLSVRRDAVAVEVNRVIVPRGRHAETMLKSGDSVEIVTFVGGG